MSYSLFSLTENKKNIQLVYPGSYSVFNNQLSSVMRVNVQANECSLTLPVPYSLGESYYLSSLPSSAYDFALRTKENEPLMIINPGDFYIITEVGSDKSRTWDAIKVSGIDSKVSPNALAGSGLKVAASGSLNVIYSKVTVLNGDSFSSYDITLNDLGSLLVIRGGSIKINVSNIFFEGFYFSVNTMNVGAVAIISSQNSDVLINGQREIRIFQGSCACFVSNNTEYFLASSSYNALQSSRGQNMVYSMIIETTSVDLDLQALNSRLWNISTGDGSLTSDFTLYLGNSPGIWSFSYSTIPDSHSSFKLIFSPGNRKEVPRLETMLVLDGAKSWSGTLAMELKNNEPNLYWVGAVSDKSKIK